MTALILLDEAAAHLKDAIATHAAWLHPDIVLVPRSTGLVTAWMDVQRRRQPHAYRCYVTESQTAADADLCYALFAARIPSLSLAPACEAVSPLLSTAPTTVAEFFAPPPGRGRLVVVEGGDGAGKATQSRRLVERLRADGRRVEQLDFPYEPGLYGALIRVILSGKKGGIASLDPKLFSFIYTLNRYGSLPELREWLRRGATVVLDRYYTANFGHQASKLPADQREAFIRHQEELEVAWMGLPRAETVFYLDLPPKVALDAMKGDAGRQYLDIHETAGGNYKENVRQTFCWCCAKLPGWHHIHCCEDDGTRRSVEAIHAQVLSVVEGRSQCGVLHELCTENTPTHRHTEAKESKENKYRIIAYGPMST